MSRRNSVGLGFLLVFGLLGVWIISVSYSSSEKADENSVNRRFKGVQNVKAPPVPKKIMFADEKVPLWNYDVKEALDREIIVNTFFHSQTIRFLKVAPRYFEIIDPILKADSIPLDFRYLALAESSFNPRAVSPVGAVGIWQFMNGTARDYGLEVSGEVDERYHIEKATKAACKYLHDSFKKYKSWTMVAASYNAGRRGIDRQIERQKEMNYYDLLLGEETGRYVFRILALKIIMEDPEKYGFNLSNSDIYPSLNYYTVRVDSSVNDFADFAKQFNVNYKMLKELNPWLRDTFLANSTGKEYQIKIPKGKNRKF